MSWSSLDGGLAPRTRTGGIAWREAGRGPPVLLIHAAGLNADAWEAQISGLAGRHRVVAADLPGHGRSDPPPEGAGLDHYVAAMAGLVDDLGLSPVPVVGHAFGAMIALGLALDFPERIAALVALNAVYCRDALARSAVETEARRLGVTSVDVVGTIGHWFPDAPGGPAARRVATWLRSVDPKGYAAAFRVFASADHVHEGRLGELACRALFVTGVADPHSTPAMAEHMAHEAPHGRAVALPGARSMTPLTHPAETTNTIATFLAAAPRDR